ncbi:ABC transporter permease [Kitasatospora sp. MMS16-BH015]|uniref:sugar ABC transporter permease n=1 Tax=Kitasatospora sp. MMS16-BH015 TaxID=2018025 RepID=UPI000CA260F8|nr:ABC transporter permease [Kitasatospora sp. MMS16-BH015]AUG80078.1 ABC transporter permease [Kitasatospora sp. MMS16-BH015]
MSTETTPTTPPAVDPRLLVREEGFKGYLTEFKRKVRGGELGTLPVVIGLAVIWAVFQIQDSHFLTATNLSNIAYFMSGTGMLAIGLVFVLLLGEIDLAVASVGGLAASVFAVLSVNQGVNPLLAVLLAVLTGVATGALHGWFFAKIGVPAFVVTLAGNLFWNGLMLQLLGKTGSVTIKDEGFLHLLGQRAFFLDSDISGAYILAVLAVAAMLGGSLLEQARRRKAGVPYRPTSEIVVRSAALAIVSFGAAFMFNQAYGVPVAVVLFLAALVISDFVLRRTTYGRQVFAVGGGIEAARRSGINVAFVRISVYAISGGFAALGGLFFAAQTYTSNLGGIGSANLLMMAIATAVIGGTSLFGGRGSVWSALLGGLVIQSIQTGLDLLSMNTSVQYMITGAVLLAAVVIDSLSRKTQKAAGRG